MKYVLDTNAVSALLKGDEAVLEKLRHVSRADVAVPEPVLAEIAYGIERLPRSKRRRELASRFALLKEELPRMPWTDAVSDAFAEIKGELERQGRRIEDFDAAVAAHALAEKCVLVTANARHSLRAPGLSIEDWSDEQRP